MQLSTGPSPAIAGHTALPTPDYHTPSTYVLQLLFVGSGIYGCFLSAGLMHERITARLYMVDAEERKFGSFVVATLIVCASNALVALASIGIMRLIGRPVVWVPRCGWHLYATTAFTMTFASPISMQVAKNLSYPVYLAVTMGKMIPSVIMGRVLYGVQYSSLKYGAVLVIMGGVLGFLWFTHVPVADEGPIFATPIASVVTDPIALTCVMVLCGMVFDAFTVSTQDEINRQMPKLSSFQLMLELGVVQTAWCVVALIIGEVLPEAFHTPLCRSEIADAMHVFYHAPQALFDTACLGLLSGCGCVFIMYGVRAFGGISLMAIMTTRKIGSVFVSIAVNGHSVSAMQWVTLVVVIAGVMLDSTDGILARRRVSLLRDGGKDASKTD